MRSDPNGTAFLGIAIGAAVGAVVGVAGQVISDVISGALTGGFSISNWQTYVGAAVGGAAGGAILGATGNIALSNATTGFFTTAVGLSLEKLTISSYDKSWSEIGTNAVVDGIVGSVTSGPKIRKVNIGKGNFDAIYRAGLTKLRRGKASRMRFRVVAKGAFSSFFNNLGMDTYVGIKQASYNKVFK